MQALIIANPNSGDFSEEHIKLLNGNFVNSKVFYTKSRGEAEELASKEDADLIFSCGGDGTFNEIANGVLRSGIKRVLVYCPMGTGKDYGRSIGIVNWDELNDALRDFYVADLDAVLLEGSGFSRYFINAFDVGVGPLISDFLESHRNLGRNAIKAGLLIKLLRVKSFYTTIRCDGKEVSSRTIELIAGNGRYLGGGIKVAPLSYLNDGLLDLYIVNPYGSFSTLLKLKTIYDGSYIEKGYGKHFRCSEAEIDAKRDFFEIDGELYRGSKLTLRVGKGYLKVLVNRKKAEAIFG